NLLCLIGQESHYVFHRSFMQFSSIDQCERVGKRAVSRIDQVGRYKETETPMFAVANLDGLICSKRDSIFLIGRSPNGQYTESDIFSCMCLSQIVAKCSRL